MTRIYGGLLFPNLVAQDEHFNLQMELYEQGLIQGIQILVAHPVYTPDVMVKDLPKILSALPKELAIIIHCGAENKGVDFGEVHDEKEEFRKKAAGRLWKVWNRETLTWALQVAGFTRASTVIHPGYGKNISDITAREKIIATLQSFKSTGILLENVPPFNFVGFKKYGFGGTPYDMGCLIEFINKRYDTDDLNKFVNKQCLIDFTHLWVLVNQANETNKTELTGCRDLEKTIADFLALPHSNICHFSGLPDRLVDDHDHLHVKPPALIREAIRQMDAVCLEIPYYPDEPEKTQQDIELFRKMYLE